MAMVYMTGIGCGIFNYLLYWSGRYDLHAGQKNNWMMEILPNTWKKALMAAVYVAAGILFTFLFTGYGYGPAKTIKYCLLMGALVLIGYEDFKEKKIPNKWLLILAGIRGILIAAEAVVYPAFIWDNIKFTISGAAAGGILLFFAYVISRHGIGSGDVKLFAVMGLYLGAGLTYIVILASLVIAACYGIVKVALKRLKVKDEIAFAPFAAIGTVIILGLGF